MKLAELLSILWARRRRFLTVLATIVALVVGVSLIMPKSYVAEVSLVVDGKGRDPLTGTVLPSQLSPSYIATQLDIIASHNVALKVVDRYKLASLPEVVAAFRESTEGTGSIRDWFADQLLDKLDVKPSREGNVIGIRFSSNDAHFAAELANAFADAYIETSLELNMDPARRQSVWFESQLRQLRKSLEEAQQKLSAYQRQNSIVGTEARLDVEDGRLAEVSSQLVVAQTAMYDAQTRQSQMNQALERGQVEQLPDILGNSLLQGMKAELTRAESKLAELDERYGKNHPQRISAAAEVKTLNARFASELQTARGSINQAAQIAKQRVAELQRATDQQKARILMLKKQRDGADVLNREVENAQRTYDAASQRASEVRLESQLNQSTVAVLNPAIPPAKPSSPRMLLNLFLAIVLGSMLAAGVALGAEMLHPRLRNSRALAQLTSLPILAELPRQGRITRKQRRRLRTTASSKAAATVAVPQSA